MAVQKYPESIRFIVSANSIHEKIENVKLFIFHENLQLQEKTSGYELLFDRPNELTTQQRRFQVGCDKLSVFLEIWGTLLVRKKKKTYELVLLDSLHLEVGNG